MPSTTLTTRVNELTQAPHGGHFIPWEIPEQWTTDLVQTFKAPGGYEPR